MTALIEPGAAAFTPAYAAPEVFDGEVTAQSDVYSFGIMMWEVLTVATPYTTKPPGKLKKAVKAGVRPDIPDDIPAERTAYIALMKVIITTFSLFLSLSLSLSLLHSSSPFSLCLIYFYLFFHRSVAGKEIHPSVQPSDES